MVKYLNGARRKAKGACRTEKPSGGECRVARWLTTSSLRHSLGDRGGRWMCGTIAPGIAY